MYNAQTAVLVEAEENNGGPFEGDFSPVPITHHELSAMRQATDFTPSNRHKYRNNRQQRIISRRKAFEWLPVRFSNDLVHGSWWFVLGSVIATFIPIVPLLDLFYGFWEHTGALPILQDAAIFMLLIISGVFFTLGTMKSIYILVCGF